ncbi:MAG: hypothetical protein LBE18_01355, partial [Planctomycetaceae bacterium]|nr:hypothetical protein [Planctomycetaceae bacterium]
SIFGEPTVVIRVPSSILDQLEDYLVYYAESDAERRKYMRFHLVAAPEAYYQELYSNNLKK